MNLRALTLLLAFLFMQAGSVMAVNCGAVASVRACEHGCCEQPAEMPGVAEERGCACLQSAPKGAMPDQAPVVPSPSSRDLVPQAVWFHAVLLDVFLQIPEVLPHDSGAFASPVVRSPQQVSLQVLHCAFLI